MCEQNATTTPNKKQTKPHRTNEELPDEQQPTNEQNIVENLQHTRIPQHLDTPNFLQRTQTTTDPEEHTDNHTLQRHHKPIPKPEQQSQTEPQTIDTETNTDSSEEHTDNHTLKRQNEPIQKPEQQSQTELQTTDTDTDFDFDSDSGTNLPQPTLSIFKKQLLTLKEHQSFLYWKGLIKFESSIKKRYTLHPNQLYRHITRNIHKNRNAGKAELKRFFERTTTQTKYRPVHYYMTYKEEDNYLRQQCLGNDIRHNRK